MRRAIDTFPESNRGTWEIVDIPPKLYPRINQHEKRDIYLLGKINRLRGRLRARLRAYYLTGSAAKAIHCGFLVLFSDVTSEEFDVLIQWRTVIFRLLTGVFIDVF